MIRKGFGRAAQMPSNNPDSTFDGYYTAVERYNGRREMTENGNLYTENYVRHIFNRANDPDTYYQVELPRELGER